MSELSQGPIQVRDLVRLNLILIIAVALTYVTCVRWDPTGNVLASTSDDGTVKLWDVNTGGNIYTRTNAAESTLFKEKSDAPVQSSGSTPSVCFV